MNIETIRAAFGTALTGVIRVHAVIPSKPEPPCVIVGPDDPFITYNDAMGGGLASLHWNLVILVQWGSDPSAQNQLDGFLSAGAGQTTSIYDTLRSGSHNLGGAVNDVLPQSVTDYGARVEIGDASYGQAVLKTVTYVPRT